RCEPPRAVAVTWEFGGEITCLEVTLTSTPDGRAHLLLEHIAHVPDARWDEFGPGAVGVGWDMALFGLAKHIATRAAAQPNDVIAWLGSDEGKAAVRRSSDDWGRASIEGGTDASAARAAAARTTAAYTGENADAAAERDTAS